ncbi:granulocyte-macrophage colony-stimulating factor receptor subunit alpha-like isoform X2 [Ammospiza nelsoni]|uniref:granulocyte-macrophage colony-stimulating factor receptor subunit alpha-like isoform X2 n=1 Tax=Ammospiza nelsoni TaxID=2857394 RepID=UPI002869BAA9|nr:granulocyte-macrophage colony-stimulating factor receptor subunit alpha-like isoform X2 [Ammospiza nelsoni]
MNGTAISNFACVIFNVSFMNCTWHVGRTATEDTQYFLYWGSFKNENVTECQNYITDTHGRHIGCRFQNVTIKDNRPYFLVNGSRSRQSIQSYEDYIKLYKIEKLTPPLNVTVNCTEASRRCRIWWQPPRTSHVENMSCFKYEIVIENKADAEKNPKTASKTTEITENDSYLYESFSSGKRYSVKIRATDAGFCRVSSNWGEWSTPVEFGTQQFTSTSSYMLFLIPSLAAGLTFLLCMTVRAYFKKTSAAVPQPRDPFREPSLMDFQPEYTKLLKKQGTEEITNIEEVMECK